MTIIDSVALIESPQEMFESIIEYVSNDYCPLYGTQV